MRVLLITALTVLAVAHYGTCKPSSQGILGESLLRRALAAMANKPSEISIKKRSMEDGDEEVNNDDSIKHTDAMEDIFVGSASRSGDRGESSGTRRSEVTDDSSQASAAQSGEDQSGAGEVDESSGAESAQASEQNEVAETESSAESDVESSATQDQEPETSESQDTTADQTPQQTAAPVEQSTADQTPQQTAAPVEQSTADQTPQQTAAPVEQSTVQVADNDKSKPNEPITITSTESQSSVQAAKKSDIEESSGEASIKEQESSDRSASGESDEITSGQVSDEEQDGGSAEAIRKGMESLSRLLKPVANGLDFQIYSGAAKPKDEDEDEEEEKEAVIKEVAKGESDKADEEDEEEKKEPVKVKKCETVCAVPMTYQQCAVPRCQYKLGQIKDLCFWLCEHQKPVCRQECKEVE